MCAYHAVVDGREMHCAWGWVDPSTWKLSSGDEFMGLVGLRGIGVGLAGRLSDEDADWAGCLQLAHDGSNGPESMERRLRELAAVAGLVFPEE